MPFGTPTCNIKRACLGLVYAPLSSGFYLGVESGVPGCAWTWLVPKSLLRFALMRRHTKLALALPHWFFNVVHASGFCCGYFVAVFYCLALITSNIEHIFSC